MNDKEKTAVAIFCVAIMLTVSVGAIINSVQDPVAVANASPSIANVNAAITFDATGSSSGADSYEWLFKDDTPNASGFTVTHAFTMEGIYEVGLLVKIGGKTALGLVKVTIRNYYPEARAVHDSIACEDEVKTFDASTSTDQNGANDIASYHWEFGDGSTSGLKTASHSFAKEGVYVVTLTVTDNEGAKGTSKTQITIQNKAPSANAGIDRIVNEDDVVTFNAGGSTDTPSDVNSLTYYWDFGDGTTGNGIITSHKYAERGVYNAQLRVTDNDGESDVDDVVVTVTNVVPAANAGPDQTTLEGQTVLFDGAGTTDTPTDKTILTYDWSFGGVGINPTHSWVENGIYAVSLTATDGDSASSTDSTTINVLNVPPTTGVTRAFIDADITLRASGEKWHDLQLSLYKDDELDSTMSLYRIPGGPNEQSATLPKYSFDLTASYHAVISYTPENDPINGQIEGSTPAWFILTFKDGSYEFIQNEFNYNKPEGWNWTVYPTSYLIGHEITFESLTFDPGLDNVTNTWDFGDGTIVSNYHHISASPAYFHESMNHTYESTGLFTVRLVATDDDGGICEFSTTINIDGYGTVVKNIAPVAQILNATTQTDEDSLIRFIGVSKDNAKDTDTYQWDFGDGTGANGADVSHAYSKAGIYMVILTATDNSTAANRIAVFVKVTNVVPIAESGNDKSINEDDTAFFNAGASVDTPSDKPLLTYHWDFGDGTFGNGIGASHVYTKVGTYTVALIVTDNDGASDADALTVSISNVAPTANAGPAQSANEDQVVFFSGTATDTPTDWQILSYSWAYGDGNCGCGKNPIHSYADAGTYLVFLNVTDDNGARATSSVQVTISNVQPIAFSSAYVGTEKRIWGAEMQFQFDGKAIDTYSDQASLTYHWDLGDGDTSDIANPIHIYAASGTYVITLTVWDDEGLSDISSFILNVILDSDGDYLRNEDEISVYETDPMRYDTDGDWLTDCQEVTDVIDSAGHHTDPTRADSDNDGLSDWEERYPGEDGFQTKPLVQDSDGDGLIDSQEIYTKAFKSASRSAIPDYLGGTVGRADVLLNGVRVYGPSSLIVGAEARIGITHTYVSDLKLLIDNGLRTILIRDRSGGASDNIFEDCDLLGKGFPASDFGAKRTWKLIVEDHASADTGYVEYFDISVTARTDPNNADSENDNINDLEEIDYGSDGWQTDPWYYDTDGDQVSDHDEIYTKDTDPTRIDTDRDGYNDLVDMSPLGNQMLGIDIRQFTAYDPDPACDDIDPNTHYPDPFVAIQYDQSDPDKAIFTPHIQLISMNTDFRKTYTIDMPDNSQSITLTFSVWDADPTADWQWNINPGFGKSYTLTYSLSSGTTKKTMSANLNNDPNDIQEKRNASLTVSLYPISVFKANTIILNSTDGQYLYETNGGEYRYYGEQEFYEAILYVNNGAPPIDIFQGFSYNTILVPRDVFMHSRLNNTLLTTTSADNLSYHLKNLEFSTFKSDSATTSGSVLGTLTGSVTLYYAHLLLDDLTHDPNGNEIANARAIINDEQIARLNLDDSVFTLIPYKEAHFDNTGAKPQNAWDKAIAFFANIANVIINGIVTGIVSVAQFFIDMATAIVKWGMQILGTIYDIFGSVKSAVNKALSTFMGVANWVWHHVKSVVDPAIASIKSGLNQKVESWILNTQNAIAMSAGKDIQLSDAIERAINVVGSDIESHFSPIRSAIQEMGLFVSSYFALIGGPIRLNSFLSSRLTDLIETVTPLTSDMRNLLDKAFAGRLDATVIQSLPANGLDTTDPDVFEANLINSLCQSTNIDPNKSLSGYEESTVTSSAFSYTNKYALLIEGQLQPGNPSAMFWNDIKETHDLLLERGFTEDNIWVLSADKMKGDEGGIVDGASSRNDPNVYDIDDALQDIGDAMGETSSNLFFLGIFAHGNFGFFGIKPSNAEYHYDDFAGDLNAAIGFGDTAKYDATVMVLEPCFSGSGVNALAESLGEKDQKRVIFTSADSNEEARYEQFFFNHGLFWLHFLNKLEINAGRAFWAGFVSCSLIGALLIGIATTVGVALLYIALGVALAILLVIFIMAGLIGGIIAMVELRWSDTKNDWNTGWQDVTLWDAFAYANGWSKWGMGLNLIWTAHPQYFNEQLAKAIKLVP